MTAEIAILNTSGIALAADSAVTIGEQKVYNSANKLFALSKYQPVGIMVYDSADFMSIPWEIIVKEYRSKLGRTSFRTLAEYAEHFWSYLGTDRTIIPEASKETHLDRQANDLLQFLFDTMQKGVQEQIEKNKETSLEETYRIFLEVLGDLERNISATTYLDGFDCADVDELCGRHDAMLDELYLLYTIVAIISS